MATLKICTHDRTHWITEVRQVTEVRSFRVPEEGDFDIHALAFDSMPPGRTPGPVVHVVGFHDELCGKLLFVEREKGRERNEDDGEYWVVPGRSCFLLSDTGKTVDRI